MGTLSGQTAGGHPAAPLQEGAYPLDLSVVVPAWNEAAALGETLRRIREALRANETDGLEWEIVVCDNASTDDTARIARAAGARVTFEPERGIARARNAGAGAAHGEWLLFIDADTYPPPELVSDVRAVVGKGHLVGCGALMRPVGGAWWVRFLIWRNNLDTLVCGASPGVFLLCRHDAFRAIGGFNADLPALEEIGFVWRLRRYGLIRGLKFPVLWRHPVLTSARSKRGPVSLLVSIVALLVIIPINLLLPQRLRIRGGWRLLDYWYGPRS
jgi:GT2 family glycosyltransferase